MGRASEIKGCQKLCGQNGQLWDTNTHGLWSKAQTQALVLKIAEGQAKASMVSGWFLDGFWIVSGWFPDGFLVLGCSHGAVALARQKRKRRDEQRLRTDASVSELTHWPGNLSALRAYAICAAGVALGWSPKRVNCLHHLPDQALNDRAKEGFIRIKAEPDERPGVCPVICTGNVVGTPFLPEPQSSGAWRRIIKVMSDLGFEMPKLPDEASLLKYQTLPIAFTCASIFLCFFLKLRISHEFQQGWRWGGQKGFLACALSAHTPQRLWKTPWLKRKRWWFDTFCTQLLQLTYVLSWGLGLGRRFRM